MDELVAEYRARLGEAAVVTGEAAKAAATGFAGSLGAPAAVVRPRTVEDVSFILAAASRARRPVTAWGGRTGLAGGAVADGAVALSLERLNAIEAIDETALTVRVQAGCVLQTACEAVEAQGLFLPLDLGARGSATIGGVISTNAGGNRVIRWGMTRALVLGLEAVLADGTVLSSMSPLVKNNTGYDLKQLFIGSEGTLGVVTRAVLRLRPKPASSNVALLAVDGFAALPTLLRRLDRSLDGRLSAFEVMWPEFYEAVTTPPAKGRAPLPYGSAHYVLVESMGAEPEADAEAFERVLAEALEAGEITDAAIAKSDAERRALWSLRDDVGQTSRWGPAFNYDVSLATGDMPGYVDAVRTAVAARFGPAARVIVFGHLGDGNLHLVITPGESGPDARKAAAEAVYRPLAGISGSISAEHGVGLLKRDYLPISRSPEEIALMRTLKRALDPVGVLNPGKIFESA